MAKMKTSVLLIGSLILVLITVVSTYLVLLATKVIPSDPIKLEITIVDEQKTYDGTPLQADEYIITSGKLLNGHSLTLDYIGSITDAGNIKSNAVCHVYDEDHTDHTNEYSFKITQGNLTVTKKNLSLSVDKKEINYGDGTDLDSKVSYSIVNGGICSGHKIVPTYEFEETDNGTKLATSMSAEIYDANGVNVTRNYTLEYNSESLDVAKTKLIYKTLSKTKTYDGEAFGDNDFSAELAYGSLPYGYTENISYDYTGKGDVGTTTLGITSITIYDEHNDDVTYRYDIEKQNVGILTINPLEIDIEVNNKSYEYDSYEHSFSDFEVKSDGIIEAQSDRFTYNGKSYNVTAIGNKYTNAGSYINQLNYLITDSIGEDVSSNFRINQNQAILTISKRPLIIYADSYEWDYDGETKTLRTSTNPSKNPTGLISGHHVEVEYSEASQIKDAGSVENEIYSYVITDDNDNNMNDNYEVRTVSGLLTVNKKIITINGYKKNSTTITSIEDYYSSSGYNIENNVEFKCEDNTFDITVDNYNYSKLVHSGQYNILPTKYTIDVGNDTLTEKEMENYEIEFNPVTFTIKKLSVVITINNVTVNKTTYNEADSIDFEYEAKTLGDGAYGEFEDDFEIVFDNSFIDTTKVGTYNIIIYFEESSTGASIDDYVINIVPGTVTVVNP